ncbi:tachykinin-4 [Tamandua tetradactyla]|uniref:tachykinin-4 n=1 Tax=Tamandua tetradactyla TaxID=48850 RepID=UPI004053CCCB
MLSQLSLLLLMGLSSCTVVGDEGEELALSAEAGPWVTVTLEEDTAPSIQFQLQEVKSSKADQFFGLMGKLAGGMSPIQLVSITELSPDQEDEDQGSE